MNIVDAIRSQITNEQVNQLGSLVGSNDETARTAINAAVPAILAGMAKLVSGEGIARLVNSLMRFAPGSADSRGAGNAVDQARQGGDAIGSLIGQGAFNGLIEALAKFGGIGQDGMRKVIGYLTPIVLGGVAKEFPTGQRIDSQGLISFFNEQRSNIDNALPMGFSLADIPGLGAPMKEVGGSAARWFVPAAAVAALAVAAVFYFNRDGAPLNVPGTPGEVKAGVADTFKSMTAQLDKIKDVDSAQTAVSEIKKLTAKFAAMKPAAEKMPASDKEKFKETIQVSAAKLDEQGARLAWVPGVSEKIRPAITEAMEKMGALSGIKPEPRITNVSAELAKSFTAMTEAMSSVKDPATAEKSIPAFQDVAKQIDKAKADMDKLPEASKATLVEVVRPAMDKLRQNIEKMLAQNGVGEKCKPAVDAILAKLNGMVG